MTKMGTLSQVGRLVAAVAVIGMTAAGCNREQRSNIDSAAGSAVDAVRAALSVIDIDLGRRVDEQNKVVGEMDTFAPTDSIIASVHTSGPAENGEVTGRWTGPDGSVITEKTNRVTTKGDAYTVFPLERRADLAKGVYTLHVIIDGKEVRTKDATVKMLKEKHLGGAKNYIYGSENHDALVNALDKEWEGPIPYTLIVGKDGKVIFRSAGRIDPLEAKRAIVNALGRTYADR